jgi:hypothetical protein
MGKSFPRYPALQEKLGDASKDFVEKNFVLKDEADPYVPNTTIPRLKRVYLGPQTPVFYSEDVDALVTALAALGKAAPLPPLKPGGAVPPELHSTKHRKSDCRAPSPPSGHAVEEVGR